MTQDGPSTSVGEVVGDDRLWRHTVENSPVGMVLVTPDGRLRLVNRALCSMLGSSEEELVGRTYEVLTHPDDLAQHAALFQETVAGERSSYRLTKRCLRADGSTLWGDLSAVLVRNDDGTPLYLIGQILDVTAQRQHQQELAEAVATIERQRRTGQAVLDTVDVGLLMLDADGQYEMFNRRHQDFLDLAFPVGHQGAAGQLGDVFAADGVTLLPHEQMPSTLAASGQPLDDYRIWIGADEMSRRALSVSARPLHDEDGAFAGAALAYSDVTDLMRAVRSRDDFLAAVSHELRTPLTSVLGHLEMLVDEDLDEAVLQQLRVVRRNAMRLQRLVGDLLDSAQMKAGAVLLRRQAVDVVPIVVDTVEAACPAATKAGVELVVDLPQSLSARIDAQRVRQVVDNLCANALQYTDPGGRVELSLAATDDEVLLEVRDTGIGIAPDDLEHLFTPFFRADEARARMVPGAGLGLVIASAIATAHGGCIEVASVVGQGTSFLLRLPRGAGTETGEVALAP